ncbi:hypothetical protein IJJ39_01270 [Candidatus Saccharibacteria bacterium]|nr:hypothetical protein [Candidatus Saccharibacteria bacterium]
MDYLHKYTENPFRDLLWNIPEQKQGTISVIGGNQGSFRTPVKTAEFLSANYPIKTVNLVLPDALRGKLPSLDNFLYLSSTESGSFGDADELARIIGSSDYNLLAGDFSKNSVTRDALVAACQSSKKPTLITRDAVDLIAESASDSLLMNENLVFFASIPQLQKLFRAVYYPKMLLQSQSFIQIADTIHKFTLSYPIQIVTQHNLQIIVAKNGNIYSTPLENTSYTPLSFFIGDLSGKIAALNLFNPNNFEKATIAAIMK